MLPVTGCEYVAGFASVCDTVVGSPTSGACSWRGCVSVDIDDCGTIAVLPPFPASDNCRKWFYMYIWSVELYDTETKYPPCQFENIRYKFASLDTLLVTKYYPWIRFEGRVLSLNKRSFPFPILNLQTLDCTLIRQMGNCCNVIRNIDEIKSLQITK